MKRLLFLLFTISLIAAAPRKYYYYRSVSAASSILTVRQASSGTRPLQFGGGWMKSSASCTAAMSKSGTVSGGSTVAGSSVPLWDGRSPASTASIVLDGTVSGSTTVISEAATTGVTYDGGLYIPAGSTPSQFTLSWTCSGTQTLETYLTYNEE
jgi:hypothetical protein